MRSIGLFLLPLLSIILVACGKSLSGTYFDPNGQRITFTSSGNWTNDTALAGTYKIDGNLIFLSGFPGGMTMSGTIEGDTISINDKDMMTGKVIPMRLTKDRPPNLSSTGGIPQVAASATIRVPESLPTCKRIDVTTDSHPAALEIARLVAFGNENESLYSYFESFRTEKDWRDKYDFESGFNKLMNQARQKTGAIVEGYGPFSSMTAQFFCKKRSSRQPTMFCGATLMDSDVPDQLKAMERKRSRGERSGGEQILTTLAVLVRHSATSGWTCEAYMMPTEMPMRLMGASDAQFDAFSERDSWSKLSPSNPYKAWGEKNRCLWDYKFASTNSSCTN